ncbi:hypothetical protein [Nonomuraea rubra]|uniref:hypothetical protein n=1 Tax=Nonomuraea rubra TaxID=46180 RepID=UPI0031EAC19C
MVGRVGELPGGFTVTFPKVLMEAYLGQFAGVLEELEAELGCGCGSRCRWRRRRRCRSCVAS